MSFLCYFTLKIQWAAFTWYTCQRCPHMLALLLKQTSIGFSEKDFDYSTRKNIQNVFFLCCFFFFRQERHIEVKEWIFNNSMLFDVWFIELGV